MDTETWPVTHRHMNLPAPQPGRSSLPENELPDKLSESYQAFLLNKSPETAKSYHHAVGELITFLRADFRIRNISELNRSHIIFFIKHLEQKNLADKTILKKLSAVSSFCRFLSQDGLVDRDIAYGIRRPKKQNKKDTADLSDEQVKKIFAALDPGKHSFHLHRAVLSVGFYTGLRSSEIRNIRLRHYGKINGHTVLKVRIKGGKEHTVPLNPVVVRHIDELIERKKTLNHSLKPECFLFSSLKFQRDKPLCPNSLKHIFDSSLKRAGINFSKDIIRYSPHSMRASLAGHLLNTKEVPLEDVQRLLGHADPSTTQRYNKRVKNMDKSPVYKVDY